MEQPSCEWVVELSAEADFLVSKLQREFRKHKTCSKKRYLGEPISQAFTLSAVVEDFGQLLQKIYMWPGCPRLSMLELTCLYNCLVLGLALRVGWQENMMLEDSESPDQNLEGLIMKSLHRASEVIGEKFQAKEYLINGQTVEGRIQRFISLLADPIQHFKALCLLGHLLLLCSVWCLHTQHKNRQHKSERALVCLVKLRELATDDILKEKVAHGALAQCAADPATTGSSSPCVGDVVDLVLAACRRSPPASGWHTLSVQHTPWKWLFALFESKDLMSKCKYMEAMNTLEPTLQEALDPEAKSTLLCLFAKCYLAQGSPQLAIQSYRSALKSDRNHLAAVVELAKLYSTLGQHDLEMELLHSLMQKLSDRENSGEPQEIRLSLQLEDIISSLCGVLPLVLYADVLHHYAKRCFQLKRFSEAAEQYLKLLQYIQMSQLPSMNSQLSPPAITNSSMEEMVVETAEALLWDHQHSQCASLCDTYLPYLISDDSLFRASQSNSWLDDYDVHKNSLSNSQLNESLHSLFSGSPKSQHCHDDSIKNSVTNVEPSKLNANNNSLLDETWCKTIRCNSRKRQRSQNASLKLSKADAEMTPEPCPNQLAVRMYLCRVDAEVVTKGFTDGAIEILLKAYDLLLECKEDFGPVEPKPSNINGPVEAKRRRLDQEDTIESEVDQPFLGQGSENVWSSLMVSVAVRMATLYMERKTLTSVMNSCHLLLQLEPKNLQGHYLRTLVLRERTPDSIPTVNAWLTERGIDTTHNKGFREILDRKQNLRRQDIGQTKDNTMSPRWWKVRDVDLLKLDVDCLHILLAGDSDTHSFSQQGINGITASQFDNAW